MFKGRKVANPVVQGAGSGAYPKDTGLYAGVFYFTILKGYIQSKTLLLFITANYNTL